MTGAQQGFLLLTSHLGDPNRKILTQAQLRRLAQRAYGMFSGDADAELEEKNLVALGYSRREAQRILELLSQTEQLDWYLRRSATKGCTAITRLHPQYPKVLKYKLGWDSPGCLWTKGDAALLECPAVSLVGSRELAQNNHRFAREAGKQAALQGYVLVSGNARGADRVAQDACLEWGGKVISVIADELENQVPNENILYLSEDGYELPFSVTRALSRNRIIHCLGKLTLVAQCAFQKGGTWDGTRYNLQKSLSPVFCFDDGSNGIIELAQMGAELIGISQLNALDQLDCGIRNFIDG